LEQIIKRANLPKSPVKQNLTCQREIQVPKQYHLRVFSFVKCIWVSLFILRSTIMGSTKSVQIENEKNGRKIWKYLQGIERSGHR